MGQFCRGALGALVGGHVTNALYEQIVELCTWPRARKSEKPPEPESPSDISTSLDGLAFGCVISSIRLQKCLRNVCSESELAKNPLVVLSPLGVTISPTGERPRPRPGHALERRPSRSAHNLTVKTAARMAQKRETLPSFPDALFGSHRRWVKPCVPQGYVGRVTSPSTIGGFALLGLRRGGLAGAATGTAVAFLVAAATTSELQLNVLTNAMALIGVGAVCGIGLGLVVGLVVGAFAGLLRHRFDALWPLAAGAVFVMTLTVGCVLAILAAEEPDRSRFVLIGMRWSIGIAVLLAIVAGIASTGVRGRKRFPESRGR